MSPNLDSPVQTQMAVAVFNGSLSSECHGSNRMEGGKPAGRRRVFVQTDTGSVLGIELDRGDNVHTVKRKMQIALNVPADESSLTFGDLVLKNDLSIIRNDSPLRLTKSMMHRSSSTPCLSPRGRDLQQRDQSGPIEILACSSSCTRTKQLIKEVVKGIKAGVDPIPVHSGLGGAYYFRNSRGESVAIVKPTDEEPFAPNNPKGFVGKALGQPGLKRSVRVGETGFREVAAYLLDYDNFANVPPTVLVKVSHSVFHVNEGVNCDKIQNGRLVSKIASFQQFIPHDFDASDHGTSSFPVASVHRIGILDIRIFNTDRHGGNLLVRKLDKGGRFGQVELVPIDHGLCLPESLEDPYFEWIHWPQASIPFSEDELEYISNLDPLRDSEMLRAELPMIREACLRVLVLCTIFLKEAALFGLCLAEIGEMMSRELHGVEEEPSELEVVCIEARRLVSERDAFIPEIETGEEDNCQFYVDLQDSHPSDFTTKFDYFTNRIFNGATGSSTSGFGFNIKPPSILNSFSHKGVHCRNPLSKLEESPQEEDSECEEETKETVEIPARELIPTVSKLSMSFKGTKLCEKTQRYQSFKRDVGFASGLGSRRSANEQMPASASFVKLSDMSEDEWYSFLQQFHELLSGAFAARKCRTGSQRQRLGTSCQF